MTLVTFLWLAIWGGMFSGIYNLQPSYMNSSAFAYFNAMRCLFPIVAVFISLLWILGKRAKFPLSRVPTGYFFYYCVLGIVNSFLFSPNKITSIYWAALYLSPLLVMWLEMDSPDSLSNIRRLLNLNYIIFAAVLIFLLPEAFKFGLGKVSHNYFYQLPFGLGEMRSNGVGRFALVAIILSLVRFYLTTNLAQRLRWLLLLVPSVYVLAQTQSRTALLGLAVAGILFVNLRGMKLAFLIIGPLVAYLIYLSGFQWRAQGSFDELLYMANRQNIWDRTLDQVKKSHYLGWGFHADRLLLDSEHVHNSYLHAMIHGGILGTLFFIMAILSAWALIIKNKLLKRIRHIRGPDQLLLMESVMLLGFMTERSFFESTAAFYGVDLLLLVPVVTYLYLWIANHPKETDSPAAA